MMNKLGKVSYRIVSYSICNKIIKIFIFFIFIFYFILLFLFFLVTSISKLNKKKIEILFYYREDSIINQ